MDHNETLCIKNAASEKEVKEYLTIWLQHYPCEVIDESRFRTDYGKGGMKRPDLLVKSRIGSVLIEVKNADRDKNIYDSFFQILDYHRNIHTVTVDKHEKLDVTGFVVATQCSPKGRLFEFETLKTFNTFSKKRKEAVDNCYIPRNEYDRTEMFTRLLWRGIMNDDRIQQPFIGVLVSDELNGGDLTRNPAIIGSSNGDQFYKRATG